MYNDSDGPHMSKIGSERNFFSVDLNLLMFCAKHFVPGGKELKALAPQ